MLFVSHYNSAVKRSTRSFFLLATVTAFGALVPYLAGYGNTALHFNFGPGDLAYLEGFEPMWEIDPDGRATQRRVWEQAFGAAPPRGASAIKCCYAVLEC